MIIIQTIYFHFYCGNIQANGSEDIERTALVLQTVRQIDQPTGE